MYRRLATPFAFLGLLLSSGVLHAQGIAEKESVMFDLFTPEFIPQPPVISMVSRNPLGFPAPNAPVTISFRVSSGTDSIDDPGVRVCYRVNGGAAECVNATLTSMTNDFGATIPGQSAGSLVTYWIIVPDVNGGIGISPADTAKSKHFYTVLGAAPTIQDVQFTPNLLGASGYVGATVTLTGVVTADTSDIPGDPATPGGAMPWVVMQNGTGAWSAITLLARNTSGGSIPGVAALRRGDSVRVTGIVAEQEGMTVLRNASDVVKFGSVSPPPPSLLATSAIGQKQEGETGNAEQWESVLIAYDNVVVAQRNADDPAINGESYLSTASTLPDQNTWTRVETDNSRTGYTPREPQIGQTQLQDGMYFDTIVGILAYTSNRYKLIPRTGADFTESTVGVERGDAVAGLQATLVPNVVSDVAVLEVRSEVPQILSVTIFDAMGREVAVPVIDRRVEAEVIRITINAAALAPGSYRAVLRTHDGRRSLPMTVTW